MNINIDFLFSGAKAVDAEHGKKSAGPASSDGSGMFSRVVDRELDGSRDVKGLKELRNPLSPAGRNVSGKSGLAGEKGPGLTKETDWPGEKPDFRDATSVLRNMLRSEAGAELSEEDMARLLANEGVPLQDIAFFVSDAHVEKLVAEQAVQDEPESVDVSGQAQDTGVMDGTVEEADTNKLRLCVSSVFSTLRRFVVGEERSGNAPSDGTGQQSGNIQGGEKGLADEPAGADQERVVDEKLPEQRVAVETSHGRQDDLQEKVSDISSDIDKKPPLHEADPESEPGPKSAQSVRDGQIQESAHDKGGKFSGEAVVRDSNVESSKHNTGDAVIDNTQKTVQSDRGASADKAPVQTGEKVDSEAMNISGSNTRLVAAADAEAPAAGATEKAFGNQDTQFDGTGRVVNETEPEVVGRGEQAFVGRGEQAFAGRGEQASVGRAPETYEKWLALEMERATGDSRDQPVFGDLNEAKFRAEADEQVTRESLENTRGDPGMEANVNLSRSNPAKGTGNTVLTGKKYESDRTIQDDVVAQIRSDVARNTASETDVPVDVRDAENVRAPHSAQDMNAAADGAVRNPRFVRSLSEEHGNREEVVLPDTLAKSAPGNDEAVKDGTGVLSGLDTAVAAGQGATSSVFTDTGARARGNVSDGPVISEAIGRQADAGDEVFAGSGEEMQMGANGNGGDADAGSSGFGRAERRAAGRSAEKDGEDLSAASLNRSQRDTSAESPEKTGETSFANTMDRVERFSELANRLEKHLLELVGGGEKSMIIRLVPANLGRIELKCSDNNGVLQVEAVVENSNVRNLLQQQENLIRDAIQNSGYKLAQFDVRTNDDGSGARHRQSESKDSDMLGKLNDDGPLPDSQPVANAIPAGNVPGKDNLWYVA